jgi:hypothetical protein
MSINERSTDHVSWYARMIIRDRIFNGLESRKSRKRLGSVVENAVSIKEPLPTESNTVVLVCLEDPPPWLKNICNQRYRGHSSTFF